LFHLHYEKKPFERNIHQSDHSLWRYAVSLPPLQKETIDRVTMGEGGTPLIRIDKHTWGKADYFMPTLSFKDRGAAILVAAMDEIGVTHCAIDSSGNAATAVAAYASRVGIACDVFVPAHTSKKKVEQITAHGAQVHRVEGSREDTAEAAVNFVSSSGAFYASHIYNPLFWEGTKTYVYELYEQLGNQLPEVIITPVGNGTLFLGITIALEELMSWGYITHLPQVIAVQAAHCAPLATAYAHKSEVPTSVPTHDTLAEGIASAAPVRGHEILASAYRLQAQFVTVTEQEILQARDHLAKRGVYVEYTSAANYAGYAVALHASMISPKAQVVIPLCGAGLKSS
jgi:threonine synthase